MKNTNILDNLKYYFNEGLAGYEKSIVKIRSEDNYQKAMQQLEDRKTKEQCLNYITNITYAKEYVEGLSIIHNTGIDNIVSILKDGALLAPKELPRRMCISLFPESKNYIFGNTEGDWIYGVCAIKFKKEIEKGNGYFLPRSNLNYNSVKSFENHSMPIFYWRNYLSNYIATNFKDVSQYLEVTQIHERPEFLFEEIIPIEYIEKITCANNQIHSSLCDKIKDELDIKANDYLTMIHPA